MMMIWLLAMLLLARLLLFVSACACVQLCYWDVQLYEHAKLLYSESQQLLRRHLIAAAY